MNEHIILTLSLALLAGMFSLIALVVRQSIKTISIDKNLGVVMQKVTDNCEMFQRQFGELHQEKVRIIAEADKEHDRLENLITELKDKVEDYKDKFHVRSADIVIIMERLNAYDKQIVALINNVDSLRKEVNDLPAKFNVRTANA